MCLHDGVWFLKKKNSSEGHVTCSHDEANAIFT